MSKRTKKSSGFIELPKVGLTHEPVDLPIRHVDEPKHVDPVVWTRREKISMRLKRQKEVLSIVPDDLMMKAVILLTSKLGKTMLNWLKERLKEPSTLQGAAGLAGAIGYVLNPEMIELIATTVVSIISLVQMAKKEKLVDKKDA